MGEFENMDLNVDEQTKLDGFTLGNLKEALKQCMENPGEDSDEMNGVFATVLVQTMILQKSGLGMKFEDAG